MRKTPSHSLISIGTLAMVLPGSRNFEENVLKFLLSGAHISGVKAIKNTRHSIEGHSFHVMPVHDKPNTRLLY